MPRKFEILLLLVMLALLPACARKDTASTAPHATVFLRDGTSFSGSVTSTSPAEITVAGDDQSTRTFPMQNVKSIEYGDAPTPPPVSPPASPTVPPQGSGVNAEDSSHESHYHPEEASIRTKTYEVPAGTDISVRTEETIDSGRAAEGQSYAAEVSRDVRDANGDVVIPRGSNARMVIRSASRGGRFRGTSDMILDLTSVSVDGRQYQLIAGTIEQRGKAGLGKNERTAKFVGGGALLGTVIGAIAGHGKGAAIGALSGAAAGGVAQLVTRGGSIHVPPETVLTFRLDQPLRVAATR